MAVIRNNNPTITASPYDYDAVYADAFLQRLKDIANDIEYTPSVQPIPDNLTEYERIKVHMDSRIIDIENSYYKDFLAIATDHRSETVYFEVDRYFENIDLLKCSCVVQYINMGAPDKKYKLRFYPVTLKDIDSVPGKIILAWNLGCEATEYDGDLIFSLLFYHVSQDGTHFAYCLNTLPAVGRIETSMGYSPEQKKEADDYYAISYDHYVSLYDNLALRWNNL
jgi:hypothetical protein